MRLIHLIYLEHQGEEEEDWAYEEEPAEDEVAANFFLDTVFISPTRLPRSRMVRMCPALSLAR